ncbi:hypothetical protein AVEN_72692-1 [Araneus ventricosus]|uniref:Uncharacterized protein n=1 Tax=Araneus ventricosus TaxID=182803 RepID=A0A4Y2W0Y2_ARAVE|nr:hypothetical protein AVEN_72692-1 [Araneus ventricosus]
MLLYDELNAMNPIPKSTFLKTKNKSVVSCQLLFLLEYSFEYQYYSLLLNLSVKPCARRGGNKSRVDRGSSFALWTAGSWNSTNRSTRHAWQQNLSAATWLQFCHPSILEAFYDV